MLIRSPSARLLPSKSDPLRDSSLLRFLIRVVRCRRLHITQKEQERAGILRLQLRLAASTEHKQLPKMATYTFFRAEGDTGASFPAVSPDTGAAAAEGATSALELSIHEVAMKFERFKKILVSKEFTGRWLRRRYKFSNTDFHIYI